MASERNSRKTTSSGRGARQQVIVMDTGGNSLGAEQMIHVINPPLSGSGTTTSQGAVTLPIALAQGALTIPVSFTTPQSSVSVTTVCVCVSVRKVESYCLNGGE